MQQVTEPVLSNVVDLRSVVALIGNYPALVDLSLTVTEREFLLLRGANGAGKSTLLHLCAGLRKLSAGTAHILGHNLHTHSPKVRCNVALLGHDSALYSELTAFENLQFWTKIARVGESCVPDALERLDINRKLWHIPVRKLSAGQRRRVAFAAVVARRPKLWLLDEPCAGLDSRSRQLIRDIIEEATQAGTTIIMASHEVGVVERSAERKITLHRGTILKDESLKEEKKSQQKDEKTRL